MTKTCKNCGQDIEKHDFIHGECPYGGEKFEAEEDCSEYPEEHKLVNSCPACVAEKNHSPHNTKAESDRTDLLDSSSEVGEQVGSVGSHNSLKAPRNKSRRVAGSEDEGDFNSLSEWEATYYGRPFYPKLKVLEFIKKIKEDLNKCGNLKVIQFERDGENVTQWIGRKRYIAVVEEIIKNRAGPNLSGGD